MQFRKINLLDIFVINRNLNRCFKLESNISEVVDIFTLTATNVKPHFDGCDIIL